MDPIMAVFILVGFSALLAGCAGPEDDNEFHLEIEPIPEEESEKEVGKENDDSPGNSNMTLKCTSSEVTTMLNSASGYNFQGGRIATECDISFKNFESCNYSQDHICKPDIDGDAWKCADNSHAANGHHGVNCNTFMFCRYGLGIVYITDSGQSAGATYLQQYVIETVTGARLILDSDINPRGIPLYSGPTMNGEYDIIDLTNIKYALYDNVAISSDDVTQSFGGYYKYVHPELLSSDKNIQLEDTYNPKYHKRFQSRYNEFSIADNRIEVALKKGVLCPNGEKFDYYLGGKYVDIVLSDNTTLACIVGDAKGNENDDEIIHYDNSIVELMGINNQQFDNDSDTNCDKNDLLHGESIKEIHVYRDKRLYTYEDKYVYYFSDLNGDMSGNEAASEHD